LLDSLLQEIDGLDSGTCARARMELPGPSVPMSQERQKLLERLLSCVKQCQVRFGGKSELATHTSDEVANVCDSFETVLQHGMKETTTTLGFSVIKNVKDLVTNNLGVNETVRPPIWRVVKTLLNKHEHERYLMLKNISTDTGRGRAWLRSAINEQYLERYLHMLIGDADRLRELYAEWSFLRDQERASMLPSMAAGLGSIRFAINIDDRALNGDEGRDQPQQEVLSASPTKTRQTEEAVHIAQVSLDAKPAGSKTKNKKKKSAKQKIVAFDDDDVEDVVVAEEAISSTTISNAAATVSNKYSLPDTIGIPTIENGPGHSRQGSHSSSVISVGRDRPAVVKPSPVIASSSPSSTTHSQEVKPSSSTPSDSEKLPRLFYTPVVLDDKQVAEDEDGTTSYADIYADKSKTPPDRLPAATCSLTPITNPDVGALFPVDLTHQNSNNSFGSDDTVDGLQSDSNSTPSCDQDYATPAPTPMRIDSGVLGGDMQTENQTSVSRSVDGDRSGGGGSLTREDMKRALLTMMERKDELERHNKTLKSLLDQEMEAGRDVKREAEEEERQNREKIEKLETRNVIVTRENELLKHQLKKYVGAVQKLRDGPQAYETLSRLDTDKEVDTKYIDYHYEAGEYEKKLIQVAEMHGELLEFNESLQKSLQARDTTIGRLRDELVSLRGPLPEDEDSVNDDSTSVTSSTTDSIGHNSRVLVNIWIPTVFLKGSGSSVHHVYQVYVRIRDVEWNIFRRYSQFYDLHKELRRKDPVLNAFEFPPKKSVGNKSERFVEDRRKALQIYLRSIVNYLVTTNPSLANAPDKETLLKLVPFFGDGDSSHNSTQKSSLFGRRRRLDEQSNQIVL